MIAICNGTDLSNLVAQGYTYERVPQYGSTITVMNGRDYSAKLRDRVTLTVPLIPLSLEQLGEVLQLFPNSGSYVDWTYFDPFVGEERTVQMKYDTRSSTLRSVYMDGTEYYNGIVIKLVER